MLKPADARRILRTRPFFRNIQPTSPWAKFLEHFESNANVSVPLENEMDFPQLSSVQRRELLRSLKIFQRGETGEGRIVNAVDEASFHPLDHEYRKSLRLFVAEEGRHARILGIIIQNLNRQGSEYAVPNGDSRPLLCSSNNDEPEDQDDTANENSCKADSSISYRLFYAARGLMGIRLKVMVLLCAEIIGCECYDILARALGSSTAARNIRSIRNDEQTHLRFHSQFFHLLGRNGTGRRLFLAMYFPIAAAACATVLLEHLTLFRAFEVSPWHVLKRFMVRMGHGKNMILNGAMEAA